MISYRNNIQVLNLARGQFSVLTKIIKFVTYDCYHGTKNINLSEILK